MDELDVGICCLGIIEHAFAGISGFIGKAVVNRGWVPASDLVHYALHAELDVRHAEEFFARVESGWEDVPRRTIIQQGLELGAYGVWPSFLASIPEGRVQGSGFGVQEMRIPAFPEP